MTSKQTKKLLPVIEAFANGNTIQVKLTGGKWEDADNMNFNLDSDMYRIKPKKELVPFTFDDFKKLICVDVIVKGENMTQGMIHIVSVGLDGVYLKEKGKNFEWFLSYQVLFDKYMFSPTEPCGNYITRD